MKMLTIFALLTFFTADCSQTRSQSNEDNKAEIRVVTNGNGGSQPPESKPTVVNTVKKWNGRIGGNDFDWDGKELNIKLASGKNIKTFSEFAKGAFRKQVKDEPETKNCVTSFYYRPLAVIGSLITFQTEWGLQCHSTPAYSWTYATVELTKGGKFVFSRSDASGSKSKSTDEPGDVYLSNMFSENDIFKGLTANEKISNDISKLISQGKIDKGPENLTDLRRLFERFEYDFLNGDFYLDSDSLEDFAIHHLEDDKVSVWISLTPKSRASQALQEHLELLLPIPERLTESLRLADSREEGFLMKDADELVGTSVARFEFGDAND